MTAYYNEIDPYAAQTLRNLIAAGLIAPGVVDERSIEDVKPDELRGYTQCHFFAGIGVWSHALRRAGWPDGRRIWTGSCPCQPFSAAGQGNGFADERHLWPAFYHLITQLEPECVAGEQVASKDADPWLDLVQTDLEAMGYAFGAVAFPSAGVGAPHIRDRTYWVAHAESAGAGGRLRSVFGSASPVQDSSSGQRYGDAFRADSATMRLGHACRTGLDKRIGIGGVSSIPIGARKGETIVGTSIHAGGVGDTSGERWDGRQGLSRGGVDDWTNAGRVESDDGSIGLGETRILEIERPGPTNGHWRDADWLGCRDGKWRPVEPGTFPLAHGATSRVGRLRAYGNAINAEAARIFIESFIDESVSIDYPQQTY